MTRGETARADCMTRAIGGGNASLSQINGQVGGSGRGVIAASRHQWSKRGAVRYVGGGSSR